MAFTHLRGRKSPPTPFPGGDKKRKLSWSPVDLARDYGCEDRLSKRFKGSDDVSSHSDETLETSSPYSPSSELDDITYRRRMSSLADEALLAAAKAKLKAIETCNDLYGGRAVDHALEELDNESQNLVVEVGKISSRLSEELAGLFAPMFSNLKAALSSVGDALDGVGKDCID